MKKVLLFFLVLVLILGGLFFWKGGHHALVLANVVEQWLDADDADQSLTLMIQTPGTRADPDTGKIESTSQELTISADTFWTEYADRPIFGLSVQGMTAYTDGNHLYMDTGKAYALPEMAQLKSAARRLPWGILLRGRITKSGDIYTLTMKTEELVLIADFTVDRTLQKVTLTASIPEQAILSATMTTEPTVSHPIPHEVADAMVRARMEPPVSLTESLEVLLPALDDLLPLQGDLTLGVECGILNLEETVLFRMDENAAMIQRKGVQVSIDLPKEISGTDPALMGLLLLRNGDFMREGDITRFEVVLSPEITTGLLESLVPQAAGLGIGMDRSTLSLEICEHHLTTASIRAEGSVPFLITTIPVTFTVQLTTA